jgi:hypothetical protein
MTISDLSPENQNKACIALKLVQQTVTGAREGYAPIYGVEHQELTAAISELKYIFEGNRQISMTLCQVEDFLNDGLLARPPKMRGIEGALTNTESILRQLGMGPPDWKIPAVLA